MGRRFWVVKVGCEWFVANGGLRKKMVVGLWVWWVLIEESVGLYAMKCFAVGLPQV